MDKKYKIKLAIRNLINASEKGGMFSNEYLIIGEVAPQIMLARIKAKTG
ncbi:MAG: hypothetical protein Q7S14_01135 [bacterium]|nr:hypothetical protein [bacterium]